MLRLGLTNDLGSFYANQGKLDRGEQILIIWQHSVHLAAWAYFTPVKASRTSRRRCTSGC